MNKLGMVLHTSGSGKLILRTKIRVKAGTEVLNEEFKPIGRVFELFGPVKNPYVSIISIADEPKQYIGHNLYIL